MSTQAILYLKRPKMTAGFCVSIDVVGQLAGQMTGADLERVARFLLASHGAPQFNLEYDGRQFNGCQLMSAATSEAILFSYESLTILEGTDSDPNADGQ